MRERESRSVPGFPGYRVWNDGVVESCLVRKSDGYRLWFVATDRWRHLRPETMKRGEKMAHLFNPGDGVGRTRRLVHHLVLEAFVGPRPEGEQCAHLDGNPSNNCVENLAWVDAYTNQSHRRVHGTNLPGEQNPASVLSESEVIAIRTTHRNVPYADLGRMFGVDTKTAWQAGVGTKWQYLNGAFLPRLIRHHKRKEKSCLQSNGSPTA